LKKLTIEIYFQILSSKKDILLFLRNPYINQN